ncbi:MAG: DUF4349 domain-containing protein [Treponema sp.]|jgi:hypothetical protein|nr:DUF4349 domain-containing protein [Treponema sp.]
MSANFTAKTRDAGSSAVKFSGRRILFPAIAFLLLAAGACSAKSFSGSAAYSGGGSPARAFSYDTAAAPAAASAEVGLRGAGAILPEDGTVPEAAGQERKLVREAELRLRVQDPEAAEGPLFAAMETHKAYASMVQIYENSRTYAIRVPQASYEAFLGEVNSMGKVLYRTESTEDVTLRYYDLEGRLNTSRELLRTFQNYLGQAKNIDEIMTVERRIAELQAEIDRHGTRLRSLANQVDYASINLEIVGPAAISSYAAPSLGERLAGLFQSFGTFASLVLVILTGLVIYGIPAILLLVLLFWLLFGRIGVIKKLWRLAAGKKEKSSLSGKETGREENVSL